MRRDYVQRLVRVNKRDKSMVMIITFIGTSEIIYSNLRHSRAFRAVLRQFSVLETPGSIHPCGDYD